MPNLLSIVRQLHRNWRGWWIWLPMALFVLPSRMPPRKGIRSSWLNSHVFVFHLRNGNRIRCGLAEIYPVYEVFGRQIYDAPQIDWKGARYIVDIGANVGAATLWASNESPAARIIAIEPDPRILDFLRWNVKETGLSQRVSILAGGIAGATGNGFLNSSGEGSPTNTIDTDPQGPIPLFTVDDVMKSFGNDSIDVLKIDCEGAEFEVFKSLTIETARKIRSIIGEYHLSSGSFIELANELRKKGFLIRNLGEAEGAGMFVAWQQVSH